MENVRRSDSNNSWIVRIPNFPAEKREQIADIAKDSRQKIGAYLGSLLDKEIEKQQTK